MLHKLHRTSAIVIGLFVLLHLANHAAALGSVEAHIALMERLRVVYRHPLAEVVLLACVAFQVVSGLYFVRRRWGQRRGFFERAQALSGGYMAFFLLVHVSAVLSGRALLGLDTNFWYAAAGLNIAPFQLFFAPYYFLAVLAFFTHVACALHWLGRERLSLRARNRTGYAVIACGALLSALLVAAFAGVIYPLQVPAGYAAIYR